MNDYDYILELEDGKDFGQGNEYMKYKINKNGNIHGKFITGDCCNSVETIYNYNNGVKEGPSYEYYKDSKIIINECYYKNNKLNGKYIEYYNNGLKKIECYYENDKKNGKYIEYYNKGLKKIECYYENNVLVGIYNEWDINGLLIKNMLY